MEFRDLGNGDYFPPILHNGLIHGYAPGVSGDPVHLMTLVDDGIQLSGLLIEWATIDGVSITGNDVVIHSKKYSSRDFTFCAEHMTFSVDEFDEPEYFQQGYCVYQALLNRITFELQVERAIDEDMRV